MQADFNPLPRKEGDQVGNFFRHADCIISIHSLVKRETKRDAYKSNPQAISIHSLVKRETEKVLNGLVWSSISIHSLVKRETEAIWTEMCSTLNISIHSLVKRETGKFKEKKKQQQISIHSLVKRETAGVERGFSRIVDFNPLPRKEGDNRQPPNSQTRLRFQSTPS